MVIGTLVVNREKFICSNNKAPRLELIEENEQTK